MTKNESEAAMTVLLVVGVVALSILGLATYYAVCQTNPNPDDEPLYFD